MEKRMYVALWKSGRQAFLDLQKWKLECECPGGQIEQRDLEISPTLCEKNGRSEFTSVSQCSSCLQ